MNSQRTTIVLMALLTLGTAGIAAAHDGWIQSNVSRVAVGDMCYIDMQFGNHGNTHRDYKIYGSKWNTAYATFKAHAPDGDIVDLADRVIDIGQDETKTVGGLPYRDVNGYLVATFEAHQKGVYIADARQEMVVSYAPERSIKCAKAVVGSVPSSMGKNDLTGYEKVLGQVLEIIPLRDPTRLSAGDTLTVQLLFRGAPLQDCCVSFIPRGKTLPPMGEMNAYDKMTDMNGKASFTFDEANYHLIVAHVETDEGGTLGGKSYTFTKYTGDLTVIVKPGK